MGEQAEHGDFERTDSIICRPDDKRLAKLWDQRGGWEQSCDGPIMVVIGRHTTDTQCRNMAQRFGLEALELMRCRDQGKRRYIRQRAPLMPMARHRVLYLVDGIERASPWFIRESTARRAERLLKAKYPGCPSCIYLD